jgi:AAA domain, putative AbiEii toxin, Type IV TA system
MHLKRVRVPDFRVLKDIDITFEPDLVPRIFPLGSLNGGGKSTLLQLVFTLLHCCTDPNLSIYIENILDGFEVDIEIGNRDLATISIVTDSQDVELTFVCYNVENTHDLIEGDKELDLYMNNNYHVCGGARAKTAKLLVCKSNLLTYDELSEHLEDISTRIFLAAPITQVFRFLNRDDRGLLFKGGGESCKYYSQLEDAKSELPGFFAYDLLAVNLLIQAFTAARDEDFRVAIANGGKYGETYQQLFKDLEQMLVDKRVNIDADFAGVSFSKIDSNGSPIQLYPEDLSHGELKRLSLYMWLKFNKIENSIVLMDEVEIGLHPDWQYEIVNDLQTWAPSNQYILATHSYELCQALTPAHVKEIDPKLMIKK